MNIFSFRTSGEKFQLPMLSQSLSGLKSNISMSLFHVGSLISSTVLGCCLHIMSKSFIVEVSDFSLKQYYNNSNNNFFLIIKKLFPFFFTFNISFVCVCVFYLDVLYF